MASAPLVASKRSVSYGATSHQCKHHNGPHDASLLSRCFFSYATPLMTTGNARTLSLGDLWDLAGDDTAAVSHAVFTRHVDVNGGSLLRAMVDAYGKTFALNGLASLFSVGCSVFAPALLHHVIDAFAAPHIEFANLFRWLGAFFVYKLTDAFVSAHTRYYLERAAMRMTTSLKGLLVGKAMRRASHQATPDTNAAADIANLVTSDVNNVLWASYLINNLWILLL